MNMPKVSQIDLHMLLYRTAARKPYPFKDRDESGD